MPLGYAVLHVALALLGAVAAGLAARSPRRARLLVGGLALVAVPLQLALVRWPRLLAATGWPDVVFFADLWPELALALGVAGVVAAATRGARLRSAALGLTLVGAACAATTVPWRQPPARLGPPLVDGGVVRQTDEGSCCAAAAATLLRDLGLRPDATEAELARDCLTDSVWGTSDLGLFRGLARGAPGRRVRFFAPGLDGLRRLERPVILFVGLSAERVRDPALFETLRDRCGWADGLSHVVVCRGLAKGGPGEAPEVALIADPGLGPERWSIEHLVALWDGTALAVE